MSDAQDLLEYLMGTNPSRKRDALDDLVQVTMDKICEEGLYDMERKKWMKNGREMFDGMDQKGDVMTVMGAIQQIAASAQHSTFNTGRPTPLTATHSYYEHNPD